MVNKSHASFIASAVILSAAVVLGLFLSINTIIPTNSQVVSAHKVIIPKRGPTGVVLRGEHNSLESTNWSGYALAHYLTGQTYNSASATWIVPTIAASSSFGYSSSWVGIGGDCLNPACSRVDHTLIQLGTEQDSSGYYAWYEMLPNPEIPINTITVNPGDTIYAALKLQPAAAILDSKGNSTHGSGSHGNGGGHGGSSSSSWLLTLTDETTGQSWETTVNYKSSLASAEWIEEAPYLGGILPLADYQTATFDPGTVNGGQNPGFVDSEAIIMYNPNGQTSNISSPDIDADGFNACWGNGNGALTTCTPPAS